MSQRYLGNRKTKEVHHLDNTKPGCQIEKIRETVHFWTLDEAKRHGYDPCAHCLTGSRR